MRNTLLRSPLTLVVGLALALASCDSGGGGGGGDDVLSGDDAASGVDSTGGDDALAGPPGHTLDKNGVMHKPGNNDPLKNCTGCHGAKLEGGAGPSCYTCHNNDDHTSKRGGYMHKSGSSSTCNVCHGPSNGGGLGPACSTCH